MDSGHFLLAVTWRALRYLHLAGGSQGCCSAIAGQPPTENRLAQNVTKPIGLAPGRSQKRPTPALSTAPKGASHPSFPIPGGRQGECWCPLPHKTDPLEEGTQDTAVCPQPGLNLLSPVRPAPSGLWTSPCLLRPRRYQQGLEGERAARVQVRAVLSLWGLDPVHWEALGKSVCSLSHLTAAYGQASRPPWARVHTVPDIFHSSVSLPSALLSGRERAGRCYSHRAAWHSPHCPLQFREQPLST